MQTATRELLSQMSKDLVIHRHKPHEMGGGLFLWRK